MEYDYVRPIIFWHILYGICLFLNSKRKKLSGPPGMIRAFEKWSLCSYCRH